MLGAYLPRLVTLISGFGLCGSLAATWLFRVQPCTLCLWQRGALVGTLALSLVRWYRHSAKLVCAELCCSLAGLSVGAYQVASSQVAIPAICTTCTDASGGILYRVLPILSTCAFGLISLLLTRGPIPERTTTA